MKGHVPTPMAIADEMVERLFLNKLPKPSDSILFPGVGTGPLVAAVDRFCESNDLPKPKLSGIELDPDLIRNSQSVYQEHNLQLLEGDFLDTDLNLGTHQYIIGNPPYVPIEQIDESNKEKFRQEYSTAEGRFNLYQLFFERALSLLDEGGRLVFITPEKFEYVRSAEPLRKLLNTYSIEEIEHVPENTFEGFTTYPAITTIEKREGEERTRIINRKGISHTTELPGDGKSWASTIRNEDPVLSGDLTLKQITERISPGIATGADKIFVQKVGDLPEGLNHWTVPTISGRQLSLHDSPHSEDVFVCPYKVDVGLVRESELGELGSWLSLRKGSLKDRSCYKKGKCSWYGWHENPPLSDIMQEKILFQDVTDSPKFWHDKEEIFLPRHSVYYLIPDSDVDVSELLEYLNSDRVSRWFHAHCQKAANGYIRLQSRVIEDLPVPESILSNQ